MIDSDVVHQKFDQLLMGIPDSARQLPNVIPRMTWDLTEKRDWTDETRLKMMVIALDAEILRLKQHLDQALAAKHIRIYTGDGGNIGSDLVP